MGGRGGSPNATTQAPARKAAPVPTAAAPAAPQSLDNQILDAYRQLASRPNELVSLVRLRDSLSHVDRQTLDAELKRLDRARVIQLDPEPNQKALSPEARHAAIQLGGQPKHFISRLA